MRLIKKQILAEHEKWLDTRFESIVVGERADMQTCRRADLRKKKTLGPCHTNFIDKDLDFCTITIVL